jgi:uncharacterized protein YdeI (YjbR/CyaY-like superfamily)
MKRDMPSPIETYIAAASPFAQPILTALRARVLASGIELEETLKWRNPTWVHDGEIVCGMAAFRAHCAFGFWDRELQAEIAKAAGGGSDDDSVMHRLRIETLAQVPSAAQLKRWMKRAVERASAPAAKCEPRAKKPEAEVPDDLSRALSRNADAKRHFAAFSPSKRREYIEWITEAKREDTRQSRLDQALEWIAEGKSRHWKYERR